MHHTLRHGQGTCANIEHHKQFALRVHRRPHPVGGAGEAVDSFFLAEFTLFDVTQHSIQLIQLHLSDMHSTEEVARKGSQLLGGLDEPLQHRVRVHLEHASCCPDAEPLSQARQYADQQLHGHLLAMQERAMMLRKIPCAGGTLELTPGATTGMTIGTEVAQPPPAAIRTAAMGTKVPGGVDDPGTPSGRGHWSRWHRRGCLGMRNILLTEGTEGLVGETSKGCGLSRALGAGGLAWLSFVPQQCIGSARQSAACKTTTGVPATSTDSKKGVES